MFANVLPLAAVGDFGALHCPPATKIATKNETCVNHRPPHVFLGAVGCSFFFIYSHKYTLDKAQFCSQKTILSLLLILYCRNGNVLLFFSFSNPIIHKCLNRV